MIRITILLTAALSLIMSAITVQATDIQITHVPYNISVPGTYILTSNLSGKVLGWFLITVDSVVAGPIVIDLKGWTLAVSDLSIGGIYIRNNRTASSITIRNGTIQGVSPGSPPGTLTGTGVVVNEDLDFPVPTTTYLSNIHINDITFSNFYTAVHFNQTNSSSVTDCDFTSTSDSPIEHEHDH